MHFENNFNNLSGLQLSKMKEWIFSLFFDDDYVFVCAISAPVPKGDHGMDARLFELPNSLHWSVENEDGNLTNHFGLNNKVRKRKFNTGGIQLDDSDEEGSFSPPVNDIYRLRQQKKVK